MERLRPQYQAFTLSASGCCPERIIDVGGGCPDLPRAAAWTVFSPYYGITENGMAVVIIIIKILHFHNSNNKIDSWFTAINAVLIGSRGGG